MTVSSRQRLGTAIRYAVCLAAISWIAYHTDWHQLAGVWRGANRKLLLLSVLTFGPAPVLIAIRLKWLLEVHEIRPSVWGVIKVTFAGNFIINALPVGTTGGDSVKAYYIARNTPHKHEAVTSVFFDRLIGVVGLVLMSGVVVLVDWGNPAFRKWGQPIGVMVVLLLVGSGVYFSHRMRALLRLDQLLARLPLASHFQRVDRAVFEFRHNPLRLLACLLITNVLQVICIISLFLAGWALGMVGSRPLADLPAYLAYTPICLLAGVLPIGVMEGVFQQLLSGAAKLGTPEAALSLSLFARVIQLIWALPGGLMVLKGLPKIELADLEADPKPECLSSDP